MSNLMRRDFPPETRSLILQLAELEATDRAEIFRQARELAEAYAEHDPDTMRAYFEAHGFDDAYFRAERAAAIGEYDDVARQGEVT